MQSDIVLHPPTPRYNPAVATIENVENGEVALLQAVLMGRDFSFLLSSDELWQREYDLLNMAARWQAESYGYGCGFNQGD